MGNRVILGKRGSDFGLFVSQNNEDVTDTTDTTPLAFDSRAVRGLTVHAKGEGILSAAPNYATFTTSTTIAHGLGYTPTVAVRWCYASDLSSGVAQRMYTPSHRFVTEAGFDQLDDEETSDWEEREDVGVGISVNSTNLTIVNYEFGRTVEVGDDQAGTAPDEVFGENKQSIYYAYIIFKAKDFTGGLGL